MRLTCIICTLNLILLGVFGGVYAFSGFNALLFICFNNLTAYKSLLAVGAISSLFELFALIAFKPFKGLK